MRISFFSTTKGKGIISALFLLFMVGFVIFFSHFQPAKDALDLLFKYIEENKGIGVLIYILLFALLSALMIPVTLTLLLAGVLFRFYGILVSIAGSQLGIVISFVCGRTFLRPFVASMVNNNPKYRAIDEAVDQYGWRVVVMLRSTPIIPLGVANLIFSASKISMFTVMWATMIACLPAFILLPFLGSLLGSISDTKNYDYPLNIKIVAALTVVCFAICSSTFFTMLGRNALKQATGVDLTNNEQLSEREDTTDSSTILVLERENQPDRLKIEFSSRDKFVLSIVFGSMFFILAVSIPLIMILVK